MGDLIDLKVRLAEVCKPEEVPEFEAFLLAEGLELLKEFRSIQDAAVRSSIVQLVSKTVSALRTA